MKSFIVEVKEPLFNIGDMAVLPNNSMLRVNAMRFIADKRQTVTNGSTLLGSWEYDVGLLQEDVTYKEHELRKEDFYYFIVKDSRTHEVLFRTEKLRLACVYIMKHGNDDGWYDMDISYKGYNDMHLVDCIDALLLVTKFYNGTNDEYKGSIARLLQLFQYRLNGNTIHYCEDYEAAYDFASVITQVDMKEITVP